MDLFSQSSSVPTRPTLVNVSKKMTGHLYPFAEKVDVQVSSLDSPWRDILDIEYNIVQPGEFQNCYLSRAALVFHLENAHTPIERIHQNGMIERVLVKEGAMHFDPLGEAVGAKWLEPHHLLIVMPSQLCLQKALGEDQSLEQLQFLTNANTYDPQLLNLSMALLDECREGFATGKLYGESIALALGARIISKFSTQNKQVQPYLGKIPLWRLNRLKDYIMENLHRELSISDLAQQVNLSDFHFARMFKQSTGMTPHVYINVKKIEKACELIQKGQLSLCEISACLGFKSPNHFSILFKKIMGLSPREFRNRL